LAAPLGAAFCFSPMGRSQSRAGATYRVRRRPGFVGLSGGLVLASVFPGWGVAGGLSLSISPNRSPHTFSEPVSTGGCGGWVVFFVMAAA